MKGKTDESDARRSAGLDLNHDGSPSAREPFCLQGVRSLAGQIGPDLHDAPFTLLVAIVILYYRYTGDESVAIDYRHAGQCADWAAQEPIPLTCSVCPDKSYRELYRDLLDRLPAFGVGGFTGGTTEAAGFSENHATSPVKSAHRHILCVGPGPATAAPDDVDVDLLQCRKSYWAVFEVLFSPESGPDSATVFLHSNARPCWTSPSSMLTHLQQLIRSALGDLDGPIGHLPMLTVHDNKSIACFGEGPSSGSSEDLTLPGLFDRKACEVPEAIAFIADEASFTFADIARKVRTLTNTLLSMGLAPGMIVGACMQRSVETFVSVLATLKVGGVYAPLDIDHPQAYKAELINQLDVAVLLVDDESEHDLLQVPCAKLNVRSLRCTGLLRTASRKIPALASDRVSFILFTSGSTGRPKGVMHTQKTILNYLSWLWSEYPFRRNDLVCQRTSLSFMPSVLEFLWGPLKGLPALIVPDYAARDPHQLLHYAARHRATHIRVVPSLLRVMLGSVGELVGAASSLRFWITAGEPIEGSLVERFRAAFPNATLLNEYGSTETNGAVVFDTNEYSAALECVPIGRPIANVAAYLLNREQELVPIGMPGELHIGGLQIFAGYLDDPSLSKDRFVGLNLGGQVIPLFNTGDIARYNELGCLEYVGRKDHQVKIRGMRVHLTYVEHKLLELPMVKEAAVVASASGDGHKRLIAYVVPNEECSPTYVKTSLAVAIPSHAVPSVVVLVDALPRLPGGKLDRKKLSVLVEPEPEVRRWSCIQGQPHHSTEAVLDVLLRIAQAVLDLPIRCDQLEDRFADLGFDSITLAKFANAINRHYGLDLSATLLYERTCISELASSLSELVPAGHMPSGVTGSPSGNEAQMQAQASRNSPHRSRRVPSIAIVGLSGRVAQAADLDEFWDLLVNGRVSTGDIPEDRWHINEHYDADHRKPNKSTLKVCGVIDSADQFDPLFFHISGREALVMDPQQRLCLMECYKAIEDAGYPMKQLSGSKTGVFVGVRTSDYINRIHAAGIGLDAYTMMGNDPAILAARIAYYFDLKGPCISVNTACSSSAAALHMACQSLLAGECEMALVGGVNVISSYQFFVETSKAGMFSPSDCCRPFDDRADGMVPGEAAVFVLLRTLEAAEREHDHIHGVIRATGMNQDGKTNGITAPSLSSQVQLELSVYAKANVSPETISYVEAHGTGTRLGDPIEVGALTKAFRAHTDKKCYCALGSVKANVGHTIAAAGLVGLVKILLCFKHKRIPPVAGFESLNAHIDLRDSPFYINNKLVEWVLAEEVKVRRAALSSFGYSGTNVHAVIDEYACEMPPTSESKPCYLVPMSAETRSSALRFMLSLSKWLETNGEKHAMSDVAYTLQQGRNHLKYRYALVVRDVHELRGELMAFLEKRDCGVVTSDARGKPATGTNDEHETIAQCLRDLNSSVTEGKYRELLEALAQYYVRGTDIEWGRLYSRRPRKIPLPTYVFDTRRYWV